MLNYQYTQATVAIPMRSGAQFTAESYRVWTSKNPNEKNTKVVLIVRGDLEERDAKWKEEWVFDWSDGEMNKLETAFHLIDRHVEQRAARSEKRQEVFVDVNDWLRVGWIDEKRAFRAYLRVTKNGKTMEAEFDNTPALFQVRNALDQAANS